LSRALSLAADLTFLPEVESESALGRYGFGASWGALGACYDVDLGADVGMSGCLSATLGAMHVAVYDPTPVKPGGELFAGIAAGPELEWSVAPPVEIVLGVDAFVPLERSAFLVQDGGVTQTVFEQPAVGAVFTLGIGLTR
jgi:hypothetical protein